MKKQKVCPHINKCQQQITHSDFSFCLGELDEWNQEDCFKHNDLDSTKTVRRSPKEWKEQEA